MHDHSLATYRETKHGRDTKACAIINLMQRATRPATDREILGYFVKNDGWQNDPNSARPRITELVKAGVLIEAGKRKDPVTCRKVRAVWLKSRSKELGDIDVS